MTLDPRCARRWFRSASHDYEVLDKTTLTNTALVDTLSRLRTVTPYLLGMAAPKLIITYKCRLCGDIKQTEHRP